MKQLAGQTEFTAEHVPSIKAKGLTPAQVFASGDLDR